MGYPLSGKDGLVKAGTPLVAVAHVRRWNASFESDNKNYASSSSGGYQETAEGIKRWSGSMEIYSNDGDLALSFDEGDLVAVELYSDAGHKVAGNVRIDSIPTDVDIEAGELVAMTVNFTGHGSYSKS